jgi:signal peptidase I
MKLFFNSIYYLLIAGIVAIAVLLAATLVPLGGGIKVKIVKSGSMEPTIHTGSIIVIQPKDAYVVGDIVTFGTDTKAQIPTTHRIVDITDGQTRLFTTKGDANENIDPENVYPEDIHGKVISTVPTVGFILDFAKKPVGFALIVGLPALMIIIEELGKIVAEVKRMRRKKPLSGSATPPVPVVPKKETSHTHEIPRTIIPTRIPHHRS